jgi:phenylpropionate dioxygenase-like ring-hydroxylating dioxygenase large terminal subunit
MPGADQVSVVTPSSSALPVLDSDSSVAELVNGNRTLPSHWYTSAEIFERERSSIFRRAWDYVGPAERLQRPGDYFTCEVAGVPVVVVRGKDGVVRGFLNICRHRHHPVASGSGHCSTFVCKYHAWSYRLDGSLLVATRSDEDSRFDGSKLGLSPVAVELWGDMVYVNLASDPPPLEQVLGAARTLAYQRGLPFDAARFRGSGSLVFDANWKIVWDNNCECYHCPTVHNTWFRQVRLDPKHYWDRQVGPYQFEFQLDQYESGPSTYAYFIWPATFFMSANLLPPLEDPRRTSVAGAGVTDLPPVTSSYITFRFVPLAPTSTRLEVDVFDVEPLTEAELKQRLDAVLDIVDEDRSVCNLVQAAHQTGMAEPGTLISAIDSEHHTLVWEKLVYRSLVRPEVPLYDPP